MSRLRDFYNTEIIPEMTKKFSYTNKLAVPKIEKIIINMGVGEAKENSGRRCKGYGYHLRSETSGNKSKKIRCKLQTA